MTQARRVGYMNCFTCKGQTTTSNLYIHEQEDKQGKCYYLKGTCDACLKKKSRRLGKELRAGFTLETPSDKLLELLPSSLPIQAGLPTQASLPPVIKEGSSLAADADSALVAAVVDANQAIQAIQADQDGEGFWDSIKSLGRNKSFADKLGDTAAKATKSLARNIPVVGDLLVDSGIVDKGIDLFSEYVWQPLKKWMGGSLDNDSIEHLRTQLMSNEKALSELAEKAMELRIKSGEGIVPNYIGTLRTGSEEDKALAHVLMKTVCKPKFYRFLKEQSIPSSMSILEAMISYKNRQKPYVNDEEKAMSILKDLGYETA
jgi:hypothetical protein